jgi:hypothetical protein
VYEAKNEDNKKQAFLFLIFHRCSRRSSVLKSLSSPKNIAPHRFKEFDIQKNDKYEKYNMISAQMFAKIVEAGNNKLGPNDTSTLGIKDQNDETPFINLNL